MPLADGEPFLPVDQQTPDPVERISFPAPAAEVSCWVRRRTSVRAWLARRNCGTGPLSPPRRGVRPAPPSDTGQGSRAAASTCRRSSAGWRRKKPWPQHRNGPERLPPAAPCRGRRTRAAAGRGVSAGGAPPLPQPAHPPQAPRLSLDHRLADLPDGFHRGMPAAPSPRAAAAAGIPSWPTCRTASRRARSDSTDRDRTSSLASVQDFTPHPGRRHRRFRRTSTTGRPPAGNPRHFGLPPAFRTPPAGRSPHTRPAQQRPPSRRLPVFVDRARQAEPLQPQQTRLEPSNISRRLRPPSKPANSPAQRREATDPPPAFPGLTRLTNQTPSPLQRVEPDYPGQKG